MSIQIAKRAALQLPLRSSTKQSTFCTSTSLLSSSSSSSSSSSAPSPSPSPSSRHKSYVKGPPGRMLDVPIGQCLGEAAERYQSNGHAALVSCHEGHLRWSYKELHDRAFKVAQGLLGLGLPKHARVGIYAPNCSEWVVAQFACAIAGVVLVNINPAYQLVELEYALNKVQVSVLIMTAGFKSSNYIDMITKLAPELTISGSTTLHSKALPHLRHCILIGLGAPLSHRGFIQFDDLYRVNCSADVVKERQRQIDVHDPVNIQFTSGTTGRPKAATLTHFNILNNGFHVGQTLKYTESDRVAITVPLYHCFGVVLGNLACLTHGSTMVFPDFSFNAAATLDAVQREGVTSLYGVPTMFVACVSEQERLQRKVSTLRTGITAGAICPPELMRKIVDVLKINHMTNCYGMTETSPVSFQLPMDATFEKRISTVGVVHPGVECKVVKETKEQQGDNSSSLEIVPRGTIGEVLTRGYVVMKGYWEDDVATKKAIDSEGWMATGDLGILSDDGYLKIVGRNKDMIIRGGENVYPSEIEGFLITHPIVEEAHVFGAPDDFYGEKVIVHIRLKQQVLLQMQDEEEEEKEMKVGGVVGEDSNTGDIGTRIRSKIVSYCKGKIAHFKIPAEMYFVNEFPLTVTGKVMKYQMRDDYVNNRNRPGGYLNKMMKLK